MASESQLGICGSSSPLNGYDFITFIADYVIGTIFHVAMNTKAASPFTRLLVDRRVPRHLCAVRISPDESSEERLKLEIERLRREHGISSEILTGVAESKLVKSGPTPLVVSANRMTGEREFENFEKVSSVIGEGKMAVSRYRVLHFFTERE